MQASTSRRLRSQSRRHRSDADNTRGNALHTLWLYILWVLEMSGYPDNYGDPSVHDDESGERLSCGCYEEACECSWCEHCDEKYPATLSSGLYHCERCAICDKCGEYYEADAKCCEVIGE